MNRSPLASPIIVGLGAGSMGLLVALLATSANAAGAVIVGVGTGIGGYLGQRWSSARTMQQPEVNDCVIGDLHSS